MAGDSMAEVEAYILSSKYRSNVLEHLALEGEATPQEIAECNGDPRPHVSRALSELRDRDAVELLVSESRTVGRYYGLTESGQAAWQNVKDEILGIEWSIEEPTDPEVRAVVELAREEFDSALRSVGTYDGETFVVRYVRPDVRSDYSEDKFERVLRTLVFDHQIEDIEVPDGDCRSETIHVDEFVLLKLRVDSEIQLTVSFEDTRNVSIPQFSERIRTVFESA